MARVSPMLPGDAATATPAASRAAILSLARPLPPAMIAPAWPMRLPGGAFWPAMKAATGLVMCFWMNSAAVSSALRVPLLPLLKHVLMLPLPRLHLLL